jgi:hypothetical protein
MIEMEKPKIEVVEISEDNMYGKFVVEPLERGYGTTLGQFHAADHALLFTWSSSDIGAY